MGRHGSGGSAGHSLDSGQNVQHNENPIDVNLRVIGAPTAHLCPVGFSGREDNRNAFSRLLTLPISAKYLITEGSKSVLNSSNLEWFDSSAHTDKILQMQT